MIAKLIKVASVALMVLGVGCSSPTVERSKGKDDQIVGQTSIAHLRTLYRGKPVVVKESLEIEGVVVSDFSSGCFYNQIVVQDNTGGVEIRVETGDDGHRYRYLERVKVKCRSLTLGSYGGHIMLGYEPESGTTEPTPIESAYLGSVVVSQNSSAELSVESVAIPNLSPHHLSCMIELEGVQFVDEELGKAWIDEQQDTNRHLVDRAGNRVVVRTSARARHAYNQLPKGSGRVRAILSTFNSSYQLTIAGEKFVLMDEQRFDYPQQELSK